MSRLSFPSKDIARLVVSFVWLYHGLVPKLLFLHPDELLPLLGAGFSHQKAGAAVMFAGWAEIALGLAILCAWRSRWPLWITFVLMPLAAVGVALTAPALLVAAFNPVTLNLTVFAIALIALNGPSPRTTQD